MQANEAALKLIDGAEKVIRGKRSFLEMLCACVLSGGHLLIDDKPGLGKTTAAKTIARLLGVSFKRIQFTPDLLPYDITGVDVFDPDTRAFRFVRGPVFANIVLADEINRTTAKVQAALLEVMAERQVTIGNTSHPLSEPFFVIATENPIETEGTFPLPEAQLDRFTMKLTMGYPDREGEISVLTENPGAALLDALESVLTLDEFLAAQNEVKNVFIHPGIIEAIADICIATRENGSLRLGASPRAGLHLAACARALAVIRGRDFVTDDDIKALCCPVLVHRLLAKSRETNIADIVNELTVERLLRIETR